MSELRETPIRKALYRPNLLLGGDRNVIHRGDEEVDLMNVKLMQLLCPILDAPFLHSTLIGDDRRWIVGIEQRLLLAVDRDEEVGVFRSVTEAPEVLRKIKVAMRCDSGFCEIVESHLPGRTGLREQR